MGERCLVVGTGMIGSSFALAARRAGIFDAIIGADPHPAEATSLGVFDDLVMSVEEAPPVDAVLVAVPPSAIAGVVAKVVDEQGDVVVFDVGSVKGRVIEQIGNVIGRVPERFVPCHPMAGTHAAGAGAARADMFDGASVFLTPLPDTDAEAIARVSAWWQGCGAEVTQVDATRHDQMVALTSHLPHLVAFAFMAFADEHGAELAAYTGPGFRDFTRIAAADPALWRDISEHNLEQVSLQLTGLIDALGHLRSVLQARDFDALEAWLALGQAARRRYERAAR
jgi:prephenate dehydrogenase